MNNLFEKYKPFSALPIRLIFVYYLYSSLKSRVNHPDTVAKFAENLEGLNWPLPTLLAWLGSYTVFIGYIMIILGWKTRYGAVPIIIYFAVATFAFHLGQGHSLKDAMPAMVLMLCGVFLLLNGAGKMSMDERI